MIFVITGTEKFSFHRLIAAADALAAEMAPEQEFFLQIGSSTHEPTAAPFARTLPYPEMVATLTRARVVVSHAGAGSALLAWQHGRRPILVPRRRSFGEHVDDHQVLFARRLHEAGLARTILDPAHELGDAVRAELARGGELERRRPGGEVVAYLARQLAAWREA